MPKSRQGNKPNRPIYAPITGRRTMYCVTQSRKAWVLRAAKPTPLLGEPGADPTGWDLGGFCRVAWALLARRIPARVLGRRVRTTGRTLLALVPVELPGQERGELPLSRLRG